MPSLIEKNQHAQAARLQRETIGWCVWFGQFTGHYWAMPLRGPAILVEASTIGDLVTAMSWPPRSHTKTPLPHALTTHRCCRVGSILPATCVCATACNCRCAGCRCG